MMTMMVIMVVVAETAILCLVLYMNYLIWSSQQLYNVGVTITAFPNEEIKI